MEGEGVSRVTDSYNFAPRRFNEFHHDYRFIEIYKYNAGETWDIIDPCRYIFNNRVIGHLPPSRGLPLPTVRFQWRGGAMHAANALTLSGF